MKIRLTIYLNTDSGIIATFPRSDYDLSKTANILRWRDKDYNNDCLVVIEEKAELAPYQFVKITMIGDADVIIEWIFNLGRDDRYRIEFPYLTKIKKL
jgi:hypothetical protein